jgi:signal transduction histidine kinase
VAAFDARVPFGLEYRLRRFDGEYRWVLDLGTPRYDATGQFAGYIGCCFDITDRRQAEQALGEAHAEIGRVSRLTALGEFAAALSHELRQPLTAIIMNARSSLYALEKVIALKR